MHWLQNYLGELLDIESESVDIHLEFTSLGLNSVNILRLISDLEKIFDDQGNDISPAIVYEYPTIHALSEHLSNKSLNPE